jgi:aminopeptidase N
MNRPITKCSIAHNADRSLSLGVQKVRATMQKSPFRWLGIVPLVAILLINTPCSAQRQHGAAGTYSGGPLSAEQAAFNVHFVDVDVEVFPEEQSIRAEVETHFEAVHPVERVVLDLDNRLTVEAVWIVDEDGSWLEVPFAHDAGQLGVVLRGTLQPGERGRVRVRYGGAPKVATNPPWVGGFTWAETEDGRPWIATSVQVDGADLWMPVKDHPSDRPDSVALRIVVPEGLIAASMGVDRGVDRLEDGRLGFRWFTSQPISYYNIALNIGPYVTVDTSFVSVTGELVPVTFWVLPEREEDARRQLPGFLDQMDWFERTIGPYPFRAEKYGIAHVPYLGMEHQTIIAYGADFTDNEWGYDWLHQHELAHEWWGNLVTVPDWRDFWVHEGFGTYMQPLYTEYLNGHEAYIREISGYRNNIRNRQPVAPRESRTTQQMYFVAPDYTQSDGDIYYKGAVILHTLRHYMGGDAFFESLRRMAYPTEEHRAATDGSQSRFATTEDYRAIVEDIVGHDMGWFFEVYVRQPQLPRLETDRTADALNLRWVTPDDLPFPMPITVMIDGQPHRVEMPGGSGSLPITEASTIQIDPEGWVLRE